MKENECPYCGQMIGWSAILRGWYCWECQYLIREEKGENEHGETSGSKSD